MPQTGQSFLEVDFSYVADPKVRAILNQFHEEAVDAFGNERYVAAVILCGGVLEGLLTFALAKHQSEAKEEYRRLVQKAKIPRISEWHLEELIEIASRVDLISKSAAKGASAVRDFRNLIHPYKLLRRSRPRWDALAAMALAAVAEISRSLSGRM